MKPQPVRWFPREEDDDPRSRKLFEVRLEGYLMQFVTRNDHTYGIVLSGSKYVEVPIGDLIYEGS